ncbi:MAG: hypothetical protein ACNS62_02090 [Candidatus Cyclobacteriaceae bacterium M3_2C_046]
MNKYLCQLLSLILIILFSIIIQISALAQDSTAFPLNFTGKIMATEYDNQTTLSLGGQIGFMKSKNLLIGLDGNLMLPFITITDAIDNNEADVVAAYGGILIEPMINPAKTFHVSFPVVLGGGLIGYFWENSTGANTDNDSDTDFHWAVTPGISFNYHLKDNLALALTYSYRWARTISLPSSPDDAFDGHNIGLALRFGKF